MWPGISRAGFWPLNAARLEKAATASSSSPRTQYSPASRLTTARSWAAARRRAACGVRKWADVAGVPTVLAEVDPPLHFEAEGHLARPESNLPNERRVLHALADFD